MKFSELKNLTPQELQRELEKYIAEREALLVKVRMNQAKKTHEVASMRKAIAQIRTLLKDKAE